MFSRFEVAVWLHWPSLFPEFDAVVGATGTLWAVDVALRCAGARKAERVAVRAVEGGSVFRYGDVVLSAQEIEDYRVLSC